MQVCMKISRENLEINGFLLGHWLKAVMKLGISIEKSSGIKFAHERVHKDIDLRWW